MKHILNKGQVVKLSQTGHRNFFYPSDKVETLARDTNYESLSYAGGNSWIAVKIPASSIYVNSHPDRYIVVWVEHGPANAA